VIIAKTLILLAPMRCEEPPRFKIISRLGRFDDEAFDGGDLEPDGPLGILVVGPLVEHDPAVTFAV